MYASSRIPACFVSSSSVGVYERKSDAEKFYSTEEWEFIQRLKEPKPVDYLVGVDFSWEKTLRRVARTPQIEGHTADASTSMRRSTST
jgi:hypothetical protein